MEHLLTTRYTPDIALEIQRARLKRLQKVWVPIGEAEALLAHEIRETKAEIERLEGLKNRQSKPI